MLTQLHRLLCNVKLLQNTYSELIALWPFFFFLQKSEDLYFLGDRKEVRERERRQPAAAGWKKEATFFTLTTSMLLSGWNTHYGSSRQSEGLYDKEAQNETLFKKFLFFFINPCLYWDWLYLNLTWACLLFSSVHPHMVPFCSINAPHALVQNQGIFVSQQVNLKDSFLSFIYSKKQDPNLPCFPHYL